MQMLMQTVKRAAWSQSFFGSCLLCSISWFWAAVEVLCAGPFSKLALAAEGIQQGSAQHSVQLLLPESKCCWLLEPSVSAGSCSRHRPWLSFSHIPVQLFCNCTSQAGKWQFLRVTAWLPKSVLIHPEAVHAFNMLRIMLVKTLRFQKKEKEGNIS